jgi:hypothetical protein
MGGTWRTLFGYTVCVVCCCCYCCVVVIVIVVVVVIDLDRKTIDCVDCFVL